MLLTLVELMESVNQMATYDYVSLDYTQKPPIFFEGFMIEQWYSRLVTRVRLELTANGLKDHCRGSLSTYILALRGLTLREL